MLDDRGRIRGANQSAGAYWGSEVSALVDQPFVTLFAFDVVSDDPDLLDTQWEVLVASATEQRVPLNLRRQDNEPTIEVRVELEPAAGCEVAWLARVTLAPRESTAAPIPIILHDGSSPSTTTSAADSVRAPADTAWGQLIQSDAAGFFDLNFVSGETHYSPAWKRLLGYADADLANNYDTWLKLIHPDDSSAAPDQVGRHTHAPRRSFSVEFRMKHRRGHWVWVHCVGVQLFAPGGDLERVVGFHLDISERKEIEEQGVVAEDRLAALTEEGGLALFDLDFVTGRAWTSQAWRELVGDPVEHPDIGVFTTYLAACRGDLTGFLARFGGEAPWGAGYTSLRKSDRSEVAAILGLQRHVSRRGELLRVVGCVQAAPAGDGIAPNDRTAAPFGENPSADRGLLSVLNILQEAILLTDEQGCVKRLNTKAERLLSLPSAAAIGRPAADVFQLLNASDGTPASDAITTRPSWVT